MNLPDCKEYIGIVSRQFPSVISFDEAKVCIISECDVVIPVGSYLIIESSNGRKYLARVVQSSIQDVYAIAKTPILSIDQEVLVDVKKLPKIIHVELISECTENYQCTTPITPVEIHSLVRFPKKW